MKSNLVLAALFGVMSVVYVGWFVVSSVDTLTFVIGVNLGIAMTGMAVSILRLSRSQRREKLGLENKNEEINS
jgi:hypothetical protein